MINPIEIIQSIPDRMYKIMTDDQIKIYVLEEIQRRQADPLTDEEVTTEEDEVTEVTEDDEEEDEVTEVTKVTKVTEPVPANKKFLSPVR